MRTRFVMALCAERLKCPGIADRVARPTCPANLRGPPWTFVFSVVETTGGTARTPSLSHQTEPPLPSRASPWRNPGRAWLDPDRSGDVGWRWRCRWGRVRGVFAPAFQHGGHEDSTEDHGETCCRDGRHCLEPGMARGGHGQASAPPRIQDHEGQLCSTAADDQTARGPSTFH
jgi:hypothetical protein